ncbi:hypothetical protein K9U39_11835 [Rhodoblastus acidophilus]|uniref:Uncharacterized protein n=1 Tax=Candidatus Rhodoblastus alkanivorans TaxID=2954117 RepID=A0ABS9Z9C8_9HYPH|nr:hypothetical protein [Candidatus Rhodoblastus alkanivorans]MCI4679781.1 hypothetical protein [Candidatus Rhodoblastus alkanivorans]MCI4684299.1 hypothetical protein [Candidatus Rhodoblastus alkanivorans]MDI4641620.1 hypothetical protein [Rhodoblastus acidophilus]
MHERERLRPERCETADRCACIGRKGRGPEKTFRRERWPDNIIIGERRPVARMCEQIATEKRPGGFLEENASLPIVRNMRRIDVPHASAPQIDDFTIAQSARLPIRQIVKRNHATESAVRDFGARGRGKEIVHCAAFIGLDMAKRDPSQPIERHDAADRLRDKREQPSRTGVEEERLIRLYEELVEGEAFRACFRDKGRNAVDAGGDFICPRFH